MRPCPSTLFARDGAVGGRGGFDKSAPAERLFLALSYQTIWFQQLPPTQVRFLVSPFRMTSTVDLICKQVSLAGDQVGQVATVLSIVETPCLGVVVEVPDVDKVVAQVLQRRTPTALMSPGLTPDSVTVKPVLAVVLAHVDLNGLDTHVQAGDGHVKGHHAVAVRGRLGRRGYVQGADLDQAYGHEGLETLTTDGHSWNRGRRWWWTRLMMPSGTSWATTVGYYQSDVILVLEGQPSPELLEDGMAAVVGMRSCSLKATAGIRQRRHRGGIAIAGVVNDLSTLKLLPSSFLLGKPVPRTTARVPYAARLSGVTVTSRAGITATCTVPVRPRESSNPDGPIAFSRSCLGQRQVNGSGPVAAVVHTYGSRRH